jgi:hypothetical protein
VARLVTQLRNQRRTAGRSAARIAVWRVAFALALAIGAACAARPPSALADQVVVNATIYPSSGGNVSAQSVTLGALQGCPLYSGSSPMYLYPGDQPYSPAASSSWALSTVLTCGLQLPLSAVTDVQVDNPPHGFESALTNAELSDPTQFHDPAAPNALPVISVDGTENQTTYVRPWLDGSDANAADQVISSGSPVTIVIYENGPPLDVRAYKHTKSRNRTALTVRFRAAVHNPNGGAISDSSLTWSWNFGDGSTSTVASPRHAFAPGIYPVTVQVTDNGTGWGGTATIEVRFSPSTGSGGGNQSGAGPVTRSHSPSGPQKSRGTHPGGAPGRPRANTTTSSPRPASGSAPVSDPSPVSRTVAGTAAPTATQQKPPSSGRTRPAHAHAPPDASPPVKAPATAAAAPSSHAALVAGLLISDVTPLPSAATTPLVRVVPAAAATAPQVRGAARGSIVPVLVAGFAVALLFGLGAVRELRGQLEWRRALLFAGLIVRARAH